MLKATPAEECGERFVYIEASNESRDFDGEVVLAKALEESAGYYARFGNLDLDHVTQIGAKAGIPNYMLYEIGKPVDVRVNGKSTFVKGQIFQGDTPVAEKANHFWDSVTKLSPPQRWYPSVGGSVLSKSEEMEGGERKTFITKVRWTNIGFSKTPVNLEVPEVSTIPMGSFLKSMGPRGLDIAKALEAGYGTDSAGITGGAALRKQSLHGAPISYWDFRDQLAAALVGKKAKDPSAKGLVDFAVTNYGMNADKASEWVERFMRDINRSRKRQKS